MRIAPLLIVAVCSTMSLPHVAQAQEVSKFIELFNERKMDKIKKVTKGYISPVLLKYERKLIRPLVIITHQQTQTMVDNHYDMLVKARKEAGKEPRPNDIQEHKGEQARLIIAWKDLQKIAKEAEVEIVTASFHMKGEGAMRHVLVIIVSGKQVVMVKTLSKVAQKVNIEKEQIEGREYWIQMIKGLRKKIEQPDAGVQSEGAPSD
jgi:hypothetical protein